jgi:AcrR family transcriptional regulator
MTTLRLTRVERRRRTRDELVDAAARLFVERGFHATSVDQVAAEAGYTKGAVYSNFDSKEDLFFAVYERRAKDFVRKITLMFEQMSADVAAERMAADLIARRGGRDDGWLAVFFEFWAHVIRHPELRERFAAIHASAQQPFVDSIERWAELHGAELPVAERQLVVAANAMEMGLGLERLLQPEVVDVELAERMARLVLEAARGGAPADTRQRRGK